MADPVIADYFRAMAIWHYKSGLPEDVVVNSFVFQNGDLSGTKSPDDVATSIAAALDDFYFAPLADANRVSLQMSDGVFNALTYKIYDLGTPAPREPMDRESQLFDVGMMGTSAPLPHEVAACITWQTAAYGASGRGRTYLGGLHTGVLQEEAGTGRVILSPTFRNIVAGSAKRLLWNNNQDVTLQVLGKLGPNRVTHGYIDDATDTQRRRGVDASVRTPFSDTLPA